ncbi:hypothetical protein LTS08_005322 [Lithohypha guttulata]|nr:hypothetical protein LTS08_005322 [Lithohypha guttulata]
MPCSKHYLAVILARLRAVQTAVNGGPSDPTPITPALSRGYSSHMRSESAVSVNTERQNRDWQQYENGISFDKHFSLEDANPTCWQYFGSSSAYSLAVEVVVAAQARFGKMTHPENYAGPDFKLNMVVYESLQPKERTCPSRDEVETLVALYMNSANVINGYTDNAQVSQEINTYLHHQSGAIRYLQGVEAHEFFRIAMICAIASASRSRHDSRFGSEAFSYYLEAIQCAEEVTSDVSLDSLQALLLLVLFTFFYPRRGDVWKLLDYACRLSVELDIHCETNDEYEEEKFSQRRRSIFWGLYSLERTFGQHMGRPSDLPEEIITAEYPTAFTTSAADNVLIQRALISHYYRLIYLRSEIFRILYMPAIAPELPRSWYEDRLEDFHAWRGEIAPIIDAPNHVPGMGTIQCEMAFNTSMNFLFQPLLLRALAAIKGPDTPIQQQLFGDMHLVIPRESYDAAVRSIMFYDRIFHAPEGTQDGDYPVTIISAHYIHQAVLTLMAHVLLAIDGRLPLVTFSRDPEASGLQVTRTLDTNGRMHVDVQPIDFSNIHEISEACLGLLRILADRWLGMVGILDLYREMHEKVLPALTTR